MAPAGLGAIGAVAPAPEQSHNSDEQYARGQHAPDDPDVTREPCDTGCVFAEVIGAENRRRHPERASPAHAKIRSAGNDISPRPARIEAKISSVSPRCGAPNASNARITMTAATP